MVHQKVHLEHRFTVHQSLEMSLTKVKGSREDFLFVRIKLTQILTYTISDVLTVSRVVHTADLILQFIVTGSTGV